MCAQINNMNNFHPLEVVDRRSETQSQVAESFNIKDKE